jgi:hypothetical protein
MHTALVWMLFSFQLNVLLYLIVSIIIPSRIKEKNSALKRRYSAAIAYLGDERYVMRI